MQTVRRRTTLGEVMFRGNVVMKGIQNAKAPGASVRCSIPASRRPPSRRYIRSSTAQDLIISGGEKHLVDESRMPSTSIRRSRRPPSSPSPTKMGERPWLLLSCCRRLRRTSHRLVPRHLARFKSQHSSRELPRHRRQGAEEQASRIAKGSTQVATR